MKKLILLAALMAAASMTLAACGGNDEPDASVTESAVVEETTADTEADVLPEDDESLEEILPETDGLVDDSNEGNADESMTEDSAEGDAGMISDNPLMPAAEKVLAESEWPAMAEVTDPVMLTEFFTLDPENENYNGMIVMQCMMSARMSEIIIIDAVDVEAAKADLEARRQKAIDIDAWYPEDQELAASSIVGTNGNYAYFVLGTNAEAGEKSINEYIDSLA